ncbi:MAG: DNA repair protein RecO [Deltaproteobacteria bacterium]|nr:DNA repair protein RecO [Deltaproteobacteria bacterium]
MRTKEFGESDLLVFFFTPDQGQLKGVAKGGRRSRKRFANSLDILSLVRLEYEVRRGGSLPLLHSGRLINGFSGIRSDYTLLSLASYMIELTEVLFPIGVVDERAFDLLKGALCALDGREKDVRAITVAFEARALSLGGYRINLERCSVCGRKYTGQGPAVFSRDKGGIACMRCRSPSENVPVVNPAALKVLHMIQSGSWDFSGDLHIPEAAVREIRPVLRLHRDFRIGRPLKTAKHVD